MCNEDMFLTDLPLLVPWMGKLEKPSPPPRLVILVIPPQYQTIKGLAKDHLGSLRNTNMNYIPIVKKYGMKIILID